MRAMHRAAAAAIILAMGSVSLPAYGHDGHVDILVSQSAGKLMTGTFDPGPPPEAHGGVRIFEAEFDGTFASSSPGFFAITQGLPEGCEVLPPNAALSFAILAQAIGGEQRNLWYWNGEGEVNFGAPLNGDKLWVYKSTGPVSGLMAVADGGDADVAGYTIDASDPAGGIHKHVDYFLTNASGGTSPGPADGVYLLTLGLSMPGLENADPVWVVLGSGLHDEAVHEAAVAWVQGSMVPEPASLSVLSAGMLALLRRRRPGR